MEQQIVCITAGQRSGTTALRSLMSGTGRFADLGEIFDTAAMTVPQSFFGYCRDRRLQFVDVMSGPDAERLCKDYVALLRRVAGDRHVLIDVKFNSWGEIRMPWTFMHQEPFFLTQLKWMKAKFIFVWRRDLVGQILSDRISERIGKWHNLTAEDATEPFALDVERLTRRARLMCQSEAYFFHNLRGYADAAMFSYERLFDDAGGLAPAVREAIGHLVGENLVFSTEQLYRRNQLDKRAVLANYAELAAALDKVAGEYRDPFLAHNLEIR